jgi:hypothetical protein
MTWARHALHRPESGAEKLKFAVAQRVRLSDQRVLLPGEVAATSKLSDILLGAAFNWTDKWSLEGTTQYNKDLNRTVRTTATARYSPGNYRTFNIGYRTQLDTVTKKPSSELVDVAGNGPSTTSGVTRARIWAPVAVRAVAAGTPWAASTTPSRTTSWWIPWSAWNTTVAAGLAAWCWSVCKARSSSPICVCCSRWSSWASRA